MAIDKIDLIVKINRDASLSLEEKDLLTQSLKASMMGQVSMPGKGKVVKPNNTVAKVTKVNRRKPKEHIMENADAISKQLSSMCKRGPKKFVIREFNKHVENLGFTASHVLACGRYWGRIRDIDAGTILIVNVYDRVEKMLDKGADIEEVSKVTGYTAGAINSYLARSTA